MIEDLDHSLDLQGQSLVTLEHFREWLVVSPVLASREHRFELVSLHLLINLPARIGQKEAFHNQPQIRMDPIVNSKWSLVHKQSPRYVGLSVYARS